MAARRVYTDADKASAKTVYEANGGNMKRTSRDVGIPIMTLKGWIRKWEKEGLPASVAEALPAAREEFVGNATRIRDKALARYEQKVDADEVNAKDLLVGIGVLTDKALLVQGKPTSRTENSSAGALPVDQIRELFAGFAKGVVEAAIQRDAAISSATGEEPIEDAEWSEQAHLALVP